MVFFDLDVVHNSQLMLTLFVFLYWFVPHGSDTKLRPTFQELMEKLRDLQRKYTVQFQATRAALLDNPLIKDN